MFWTVTQTFTAPDSPGADAFGYSVALDGNNILIGSPFEESIAASAGAAYLFKVQGDNLVRTLRVPSPEAGDLFGLSVAIKNNHLLVGSPNDDIGAFNSGSAFFFDVDTGRQVYPLTNPTPLSNEFVGFSVALGGDYIVLGAPAPNSGSGRVYIFNTQGNLLRTIIPDTSPPIGFGWSVATDGKRVLIGSPFVSENQSTINTGRAFLYEIATGELLSVIFPPPFPNPLLSNSRFGISVALSDNRSIISAPGYQSFGIASIYNLPPSESQASGFFLNPSPSSGDRFGLPVALDGNYVLIGASGEDSPTNNEGVVYVFEANTGRLIQTLSSPSPLEVGSFGASVSIDGTTILIGAPGDNGGSGAAYLFQLFDPAQYAASNIDLLEALGYNLDALSQHYRDLGQQEGRAIDTFDEISYLAANTDLIRAFGFNAEAATQHYIQFGYFERRPITGSIPDMQ